MENKTNREYRPQSRFYEKDYSKLEVIFQRAVERSRQKKIIHYGSERLYSEDSLRRIAQDSFKTVSSAEPVHEKDVHTELRDLEAVEKEPEVEENELFNFLSSAGIKTEENDETLTSESAFRVFEALADVSEEETKSPVELVEEIPHEEELETEEPQKEELSVSLSELFQSVEEKTEPLVEKEEPAVSFEELTEEIEAPAKEESTSETSDEVELKEEAAPLEVEIPASSETTETELKEETEPVLTPERREEFFEDDYQGEAKLPTAKEVSEARKDVTISQLALIAAIICLGVYLFIFFRNFSGFDYIALILTLIGFFLAADMKARGLIFSCIAMIVILIICMAISVYRTSEIIAFYHYIWFLLIPLAISTSYAFINSRRRLREIEKPNAEQPVEEVSEEKEPEKREYEETEEELLDSVRSYTSNLEEPKQEIPLFNQKEEVVEEEPVPEVKEPSHEKEEIPETNEDQKLSLSDRVEFITDMKPEEPVETPASEEIKQINKQDLHHLLDDYQEENTFFVFEEESEANFENTFDWNDALQDDERTDNPSVIDEINKDVPLASLFDDEDFKDENLSQNLFADFFEEIDESSNEPNDLGKLLESLEGQDENSITSDMTNSETIWQIIGSDNE